MAILLKKPETVVKYTVPQLVSELFESRTVAHKAHLITNSYAFHKATNDYYDGIVGLADDIAEEFQGIKGIQTYMDPKLKNANFVEYLTSLYDLCTATQDSCELSNVVNSIDEVKSLISSTLYKIKNLK